ncbi:MAG TPA: class E sortase [Thermoleophilia bacterium]|jgi:sortase A|nr:class E sortase [Thermoleophilia bacterium]HQG02759.1 class E sortase [Thermoleophilia bacterium]HQG54166.1 class E sortase [Thermoleophilia bacterium]HQJ97068.1 class E sortase [Thermoleophilia bacterium]
MPGAPVERPTAPAGEAVDLRRIVADLLLVVGGLVLAYPLWSGLVTVFQQDRLSDVYGQDVTRFGETVRATKDATSKRRLPPEVEVRRLAEVFAGTLQPGDAVGKLTIPSLGLSRVIQEGVRGRAALDPDGDRGLLRNGPVHYGSTPLPGTGEPFAVAGHRTTYGAPFSRLDKLDKGDRIVVDTPYARFTYAVAKVTTVTPDEVGVLFDRGYGLVLTTCTPRYSASHRLIVWGRLVSFDIDRRLRTQG